MARSVAALVSGQMRTLDRCIDNIRWALPANTEYYVHAVHDADAEKAHLLKPTVLVIEPDVSMKERYEYVLQTRGYTNAIQSCLRQMYFLDKMWQTYERTGDRHDWVIRVRPDTVFLTRLENLDTKPDGIWFPEHDNWFGLNDRLAYGERSLMQRYFTRLSELDRYIDLGNVFHMETFLAWMFRDVKIERTTAWSVTLRPNMEHVGPYYSEGWNDPRTTIPTRVLEQVEIITGQR